MAWILYTIWALTLLVTAWQIGQMRHEHKREIERLNATRSDLAAARKYARFVEAQLLEFQCVPNAKELIQWSNGENTLELHVDGRCGTGPHTIYRGVEVRRITDGVLYLTCVGNKPITCDRPVNLRVTRGIIHAVHNPKNPLKK